MVEIILFLSGTVLITIISTRSLRQPASHGFYRFFAWEIILGMFVINIQGWFDHPFRWYQIISWVLLIASVVPLTYGVLLLRNIGKPTDQLEATTRLVTVGIYRFIRHPLYASLLYIAWGIYFKSPSLLDLCLVVVATTFLFATAIADERECIVKFGEEYSDYMKTTRMFIPFLI